MVVSQHQRNEERLLIMGKKQIKTTPSRGQSPFLKGSQILKGQTQWKMHTGVLEKTHTRGFGGFPPSIRPALEKQEMGLDLAA